MKLSIKGNDYGLEWGQLAFEKIEDSTGLNGRMIIATILDEVSQGRDRTLRDLAFEAIKLWCRKNSVECGITIFDFVEWLDSPDADKDQVAFINKSFEESYYQGKSITEWIDYMVNLITQSVDEGKEDDKKKVTKTRGRKSSKTASAGD